MDQKLLESFIGGSLSDAMNELHRRMAVCGWLKDSNAVIRDIFAVQFSEKGIAEMSKLAPLVKAAVVRSDGKPMAYVFEQFVGLTPKLISSAPDFFLPPLNWGETAAFLLLSASIYEAPPTGFNFLRPTPPASDA